MAEQTTVVVDYGSGNLHSASKALERSAREAGLDMNIEVTASAQAVRGADRVVLPGVGAFGDCRAGLDAVPGLSEALQEFVCEKQRPFLGICVGMQLLATRGHEFGVHEGFGWIPGEVRPIVPADPSLKIPHMGWNTLQLPDTPAVEAGPDMGASSDASCQSCLHPVLDQIALGRNGWHAYFVHSYHLIADEPGDVLLVTDYGGPITAMVGRDNIVGTQFHPEKSQMLGLKLLANFLNWSP
jgi:glutamine amidotransferase